MRDYLYYFLGYPTDTPTETKRIDFFYRDFFDENGDVKTTLFANILENDLLQDYTTIVLHDFDFTKEEGFHIILTHVISEKHVFHNATFSFPQLEILLSRHFDLSRCTYKTPPLLLQEYWELYQLCSPDHLSSLHGACVTFENATLNNYPENIIACCTPINFKNTRATEAQLLSLFNQRPPHFIADLKHFIFSNMDLSVLVKNYADRLKLGNTSIEHCIFDLDALSICAVEPKFHMWFSHDAVSFSMKFNDWFIPDMRIPYLSEKITRHSTPRLMSEKNPFEILQDILNADEKIFEKPMISNLSNGQKMLWLFYCMVQHPHHDLSKRLYRILGINRQFNAITHPDAHQIDAFAL